MKNCEVTGSNEKIIFIKKENCVATSSLEINIINLTNIQKCSINLILIGRKNVFGTKKRRKIRKKLKTFQT